MIKGGKRNSIASGLRFNKRRITSLNVTYEYFIFPNKPNFIEILKYEFFLTSDQVSKQTTTDLYFALRKVDIYKVLTFRFASSS